MIIATGAGVPRDLKVVGRQSSGVEFAVDFLTQTTKRLLVSADKTLDTSLSGKKVIVIGGEILEMTVSERRFAWVRHRSNSLKSR